MIASRMSTFGQVERSPVLRVVRKLVFVIECCLGVVATLVLSRGWGLFSHSEVGIGLKFSLSHHKK